MVLSVLDTLEICFSANLSGVDAQLEGLSGQLRGLSGAALETAGAMRPVGDRMVSALRSALTAGLPGVRQDGDRLIVINAALCGAYRAGDIVIARKESFDEKPIVKRVIAAGGQTVDIDFDLGRVYVDGVLLEENVRRAGKEPSWVLRSLLRQGYRDEESVLLALWDGGEKLTVFPRDPGESKEKTGR